jgi:hypothetical protein
MFQLHGRSELRRNSCHKTVIEATNESFVAVARSGSGRADRFIHVEGKQFVAERLQNGRADVI